MSKKSRSSVNWFVDHLTAYGFNLQLHKQEIGQAREIHMYEIINAHMGDDNSPESRLKAEEYYNQKFRKA